MRALIDFMNGPLGRAARVILGLVLIAIGLVTVGGVGGVVLAVLGVVAIVMGAAGRCAAEFIPGT